MAPLGIPGMAARRSSGDRSLSSFDKLYLFTPSEVREEVEKQEEEEEEEEEENVFNNKKNTKEIYTPANQQKIYNN
ncbi:hypothetical protein E2C01_098341 [Portunus trituberculatus]|uniref:Uncharacterized protein n=1 Tax=Portunus trituberculatus TaxID=210409 RepID=A0A5B7K6T0_PORTR|nr:hypothetical protein [Portunus trituberculatus]